MNRGGGTLRTIQYSRQVPVGYAGGTGPVETHSQNLYACYRSQRVHCGAPTDVGNRVRVRAAPERAPEARLVHITHLG